MPSNPTASGNNKTADAGESFSISELFDWSDVDGDIVSFALQDRDSGGGYLTRNSAPQAAETLFDPIPLSQLSQWRYVAGSEGTTSTLGFNANDSRGGFSPSKTAKLTVPDAPQGSDPTASGNNKTADAGESFSISELFDWSDVDGDIGPATLLCRPKCSFKPPFARKLQDFSSPMLSDHGADCRSR